MRLSLAWKLLLGYLLVVAVSITTFAVLANRSTERELRLAMGRNPEGTLVAAEQLAAYFRGRGSWEGVDRLYAAGQHMGGMMGRGVGVPAVVDLQGMPLLGDVVGPQDVRGATPILVDGTIVGYVLPPAAGAVLQAERDLVARVNRAILLAALLSLGAALVSSCTGFSMPAVSSDAPMSAAPSDRSAASRMARLTRATRSRSACRTAPAAGGST